MDTIWIIAGGIALIVAAGIGLVVARRRAKRDESPTGTDDIYPMW